MKYTIEIQYVKPKEAESLATVTAKNTEGIIVLIQIYYYLSIQKLQQLGRLTNRAD